MLVLPKCRNVIIFKISFTPSPSPSPSNHFVSFHSTPISFEKWKIKWKSEVRRDQQPTKNYIKYATRQKRADAKKALKNLLFNSGSSTSPLKDNVHTWRMNGTNNWDASETDNSESFRKEGRAKASARRSRKSHHNKIKRKLKRENIFEDYDENPEKIFQANFGSQCYTWSFNPWKGHLFERAAYGFEWKDNSNWTRSRSKEWKTPSDTESDDEYTAVVGSCSDRSLLGLPPRGPLKIEDVKNAFRVSALKWHPDKHQGPSQAKAEEKFKLCVDAYKSLCNALSSA